MDLSKYKGIIFDMDGTLIDSLPAHFDAWRRACAYFDMPFDETWLLGQTGTHSLAIANAMIARYHVEVDPIILSNTKMRYFDLMEDKGDVIPSTFAILEKHRHDKKIAIATGSKKRCADDLLFNTGVLPLIDTLVTSNHVTSPKPDPESFLLAAKRLGLQPHECVVFEDAPFGFQAAQAAGMDYVPVVNGQLQPLVRVEAELA